MNPILSQTQWLELPTEVRNKLREVFHIQRSMPTWMVGGTHGKVQCDGSTDKDIAVMSIEAMQKYLGNYNITDFFALFTEVLTRISGEEKKEEKKEVVIEVVEDVPVYIKWQEDLMRIKEESEKLDLVYKLKGLVKEIFPQPIKNEIIQKTTNKRTKKRN